MDHMDFPIDNYIHIYIYIWEYDLLCYIYGIIIYGLKWDIFMELFLDIYGNIYNIYWISMEIFFHLWIFIHYMDPSLSF